MDQKQKIKKQQLLDRAQKVKEQYLNKGVVYISRIPPHMRANKLKEILSSYGEVGRVHMTPEDQYITAKRKRLQGVRSKGFVEAWVEFDDKKIAKNTADLLNGQMIGGKKRSQFHYDTWNMKYLHDFKFDQLSEELIYLKSIREQKMQLQISLAKQERDFYIQQVDKAKKSEAILERKSKKLKNQTLHDEDQAIEQEDTFKNNHNLDYTNKLQKDIDAINGHNKSINTILDLLAS